MPPDWSTRLKLLAEQKGVAVLRFGEDEWDTLKSSRRGISQFTVARAHDLLRNVRRGMLCLAESRGNEGALRLGFIASRTAVSTLDTRVKLKRLVALRPASLAQALSQLPASLARGAAAHLRNEEAVFVMGPKASGSLIESLSSIEENHGPMRTVAAALGAPTRYGTVAALQEDAVRSALRAFGLDQDVPASVLELVPDRETALARVSVLEDAVIEHDARQISGYDLIGSDLTGRAVFEDRTERLEVFTANKRPLEAVFGVDLIYLNMTKQCIVMLQYKMLEAEGNEPDTDWIYRPDASLGEEIARMRRFASEQLPGPTEYRLNPSVFFLKFVKRDALLGKGGIITPLDHYEKIQIDPSSVGPRGGLRVSFHALRGRYLRQESFLDLLRSGYIGAYADTTERLRALISAVLSGNRALVAAIQQSRRLRTDGQEAGHDTRALRTDDGTQE